MINNYALIYEYLCKLVLLHYEARAFILNVFNFVKFFKKLVAVTKSNENVFQTIISQRKQAQRLNSAFITLSYLRNIQGYKI